MAVGEKCDIIYLPPRNAGDRLPFELQDAYEGQYYSYFTGVVMNMRCGYADKEVE